MRIINSHLNVNIRNMRNFRIFQKKAFRRGNKRETLFETGTVLDSMYTNRSGYFLPSMKFIVIAS